MSHLSLIWAGLVRKRALFLACAFAVAFAALGVLMSVKVFEAQYRAAAKDRLVVNPVGSANPGGGVPLPLAYKEQIARLPNVAHVTAQTLLVGYHRHPEDVFYVAPADAGYFTFYSELNVTDAQIAALKNTPNGFIATQAFAHVRDFKVGDTVTIRADNFVKEDGSPQWTFELVAIVDGKDGPISDKLATANYAYVNGARASGKDTLNRLLVLVHDPAEAGATASAIDAMFADTAAPTRTVVESLATRQGKLGRFRYPVTEAMAVTAAALLALAIALGLRIFRDRMPTLLDMKLRGASRARLVGLVTTEVMLPSLLGAAVGLMIAVTAVAVLKASIRGHIYVADLPVGGMAAALATAFIIAAAGAVIPIWRVRRL